MIGTKALTLAVLLTAAGLSAPAAAGSTPLRSHVVRGDIRQLERAIDRADYRDTISEREAARLEYRTADLRHDFRHQNANGLTRAETIKLERRAQNIRTDLRRDRQDRIRRAR